MEVFRKQGNGTSIIQTDKLESGDLLVTPELIDKWNQSGRPNLNDDCTDIIDLGIEVIVPQTISPMNFKLQLIYSGISIQSVYDEIDKIENPIMKEVFKVKFESAQEIERNDESLLQMAQIMQISKEQLDQIFIDASNIQEK